MTTQGTFKENFTSFLNTPPPPQKKNNNSLSSEIQNASSIAVFTS